MCVSLAEITLPVEFILVYAVLGGTILTTVVYFVGRKAYERALSNPNSRLRGAFRKALTEDVKPVIDGAIAAIKFPQMPAIPDYGAQIRQMHGQLNARLTKEMADMKAAIPAMPALDDFTAVKTAFNDQLVPAFNALPEAIKAEVLKSFSTPEFDEAMKRFAQTAWGRRIGEARRKESGGELEDAMAEAEWAVSNPEQFQALVQARSFINSPLGAALWPDEKKRKLVLKQAEEYAQQGADLKTWIDKMGGMQGGAPGVKLFGGGGGDGGLTPLG